MCMLGACNVGSEFMKNSVKSTNNDKLKCSSINVREDNISKNGTECEEAWLRDVQRKLAKYQDSNSAIPVSTTEGMKRKLVNRTSSGKGSQDADSLSEGTGIELTATSSQQTFEESLPTEDEFTPEDMTNMERHRVAAMPTNLPDVDHTQPANTKGRRMLNWNSSYFHNIPGTPLPDSQPTDSSIPISESEEDEVEDTTGGLATIINCEGAKIPDKDNLFFRDGRRRIDLLLVYEEEDIEEVGVLSEQETVFQETRRQFHKSLEKEGLELELEGKQNSFDQKTYFLKIHVPWKVMRRMAEAVNLKMPTKTFKRIIRADSPDDDLNSDSTSVNRHRRRFVSVSVKAWDAQVSDEKSQEPPKISFPLQSVFELDPKVIAREPSFLEATHSDTHEDQFVIKDRENYYTSAQRSQIVWQILLRAKYDDDQKAGIRKLLNNGTYITAFPLHEGSYNRDSPNGIVYDRKLLYLEWARPGRWYKRQPLWLVRKYFGDKIALYFAWLGFYTEMLIPPSIVGLLCFLYGLFSMDSKDNIPSKEICDMSVAGNITLCPLCDKVCNYQKLGDSCVFAKVTYLFDNRATVFFAIFMSFWATMFLELWKRKQAVIAWEWDLQNVEEDEEPRPEYEASVKTFRTNPVTRQKEPYIPTWNKALRIFVTGSTVTFMILIVLSAVVGTIIYRISVVTVIYEGGNKFVKRHAKIFTTITAALINLVIIMILTKIYHHLALWLTTKENPRTQTEYEDSYTFKIFVFEFMNYYSSLIYIAFFKGRFFSYPGDTVARKSKLLRLKTDVCDPAGCLSELCIQLAIIMIGKQCFNNFLELAYPAIYNWLRYRTQRSRTKDITREYTRWEEDYQLQDPGRLALFEEYLEMVIQYGFVTLFVAAFPLAPLFALLNNIGEIRLDAYKYVAQSRRPLAERVEDIGAWYGVLQAVTYCAVVSNAFVIAYTSDYIPRMVYTVVYSKTHDLTGYIDYSLSVFNTTHYTEEMRIDRKLSDKEPDTCQYRGYRNGPDHIKDPYGLSPEYWHVFAARLAFVVVFEHLVFALTGILAYVIPDVPAQVRTQIKRERLLAKEMRYQRGIKGDDLDDLIHTPSKVKDVIRRTSLDRRLSRNSFGKR
ncbi:anoctamin-4 isoform X1 [Nilaparvata lugens]|uniref:anoctamin-4 isoform X1 n=2 Tax=Nilaparvata lugens TaxID=108931 RepID=UPI00193DA900|nr:anoctamin-4 isoform X1 [Nilaparvata lugens]